MKKINRILLLTLLSLFLFSCSNNQKDDNELTIDKNNYKEVIINNTGIEMIELDDWKFEKVEATEDFSIIKVKYTIKERKEEYNTSKKYFDQSVSLSGDNVYSTGSVNGQYVLAIKDKYSDYDLFYKENAFSTDDRFSLSWMYYYKENKIFVNIDIYNDYVLIRLG